MSNVSWIQQEAILPREAAGSFGGRVAVEEDWLVVADERDDRAGTDAGAVFVYERRGDLWALHTTLTAPDARTGDCFGSDVAISAGTIVVGAEGHDSAAEDAGALYFFQWNGRDWLAGDMVTAIDATAGHHLGGRVAIDGDWVVAGTPDIDELVGAAYVFERREGDWIQTDKLVPRDAKAGYLVGVDVDVDGSRIVVGAPDLRLDASDVEVGGAYVYQRNEFGHWSETATLFSAEVESGGRFGSTLSIDGDAVVVGAPGIDASDTDSGAVYLFRQVGQDWLSETALYPDAGTRFDGDVAIDGDTVVVSASGTDPDGAGDSVARVYNYNGSTWTRAGEIAPRGDGPTAALGALAVHGDVVVIGATSPDVVFPFVRETRLLTESFEATEWNQWIEGTRGPWYRSFGRATDGNFAASVNGPNGYATLTTARPLDLTGHEAARLEFDWFMEGDWGIGEYLAVDLYDGGRWTEMAALRGNEDPPNQWHGESVAIDGSFLFSGFRIRFRASVAGAHFAHLDDVRVVTGTANDGAVSSFTFVMLPDTQYYSANYPYQFVAQTDWIARHAVDENLSFVSHVGDVVEHGDGLGGENSNALEWLRADAAMDLLDGDQATHPDGLVPYSVVPGNHDFDMVSVNVDAERYVEYFGPSRFAGRSWYGGHSPDQTSSYQRFRAGGIEFLHIGLSWDPGATAIAWARGVIQTHPDIPVILSTHSYLGPTGRNASGERIFWDLVWPHPQVFMVLSGHENGEYRQMSRNAAGLEVIEILANYQFRANGGDGWLRLMKFLPDLGRIEVRTYSPTLDLYEADGDSQFTVDFDFDGRFRRDRTAPRVLDVLLNADRSDPGDLPHGPQPTSWNRQRSSVRSLRVRFSEPVVVNTTDLRLTSLGLDAAAHGVAVVPLDDDQLSIEGNDLVIEFDDHEHLLPEGAYRLEVSHAVRDVAGNRLDGNGDGVSGDAFLRWGNAENGFYTLSGDFNGDMGVSILDFPAFAYWFGHATGLAGAAPEYVDLNADGGVSIFDFDEFSSRFGARVVVVDPLAFVEDHHGSFLAPSGPVPPVTEGSERNRSDDRRHAGPLTRRVVHDTALDDLLVEWTRSSVSNSRATKPPRQVAERSGDADAPLVEWPAIAWAENGGVRAVGHACRA